MIYKFESYDANGNTLSTLELYVDVKNLVITLNDTTDNKEQFIELHQDQVYDLIGALHSVQGKIKKTKAKLIEWRRKEGLDG